MTAELGMPQRSDASPTRPDSSRYAALRTPLKHGALRAASERTDALRHVARRSPAPQSRLSAEAGTAPAEQPPDALHDVNRKDAEPQTDPPSRLSPVMREILDWIKYIVMAVVIGLLIVIFVIQRNSVVGNSMWPTLHNGDQLIVEKISKFTHGIHFGDIITVDTRGLPNAETDQNIIKRVIGVPGDTIEIRDEYIYRNGERLEEPYTADSSVARGDVSGTSWQISENQYFVLGDNRDNSRDSRRIGPIPASHIIGKVLVRFYPLDRIGGVS